MSQLDILISKAIWYSIFVAPALIIFGAEYFFNNHRPQKRWLQVTLFAVFILIFVYGHMRRTGIIIYSTDEPAGFLWSTWDFNGMMLQITSVSALIGLLIYHIHRHFKQRKNKYMRNEKQ